MTSILSALTAGRQVLKTLANNKIKSEDRASTRVDVTLQTSHVYDGVAVSATLASLSRASAPFLLRDTATNSTQAEGAEMLSTIYARFSAKLGHVGSEGETLAGHLGRFFTTLTSPVEAPHIPIFFERLLTQASDLLNEFGRLSTLIQGLRSDADQEIGQNVHTLNGLLKEYEVLNNDIGNYKAGSPETFGLLDRRDALFLEISKYLQVYETPSRPPNVVASNVNYLWTAEGRPLVTPDHANTLSFEASPDITPSDAFGSGRLSDITLNFDNLMLPLREVLQKGSLSALFEMRDTLLPHFQATLDEAAFVLAKTVNSLHNQGASFDAAPVFESNADLSPSFDLSHYTGILRVALTDNLGAVQEWVDVDLSATSTLGDLITTLNGGLTQARAQFLGTTLTLSSLDHSLGLNCGALGGNAAELLSKLSLNNLFTSALPDWLTQTESCPAGLALDLQINPRLTQNPRQVAHGILSQELTLNAGDTVIQASDTRNFHNISLLSQTPQTFQNAGFWDSTDTTFLNYTRAWMGDIATRAHNASRIAQDQTQIYNTTYEELLTARGVDPIEAEAQQAQMQQYVESLMTLYAQEMRLNRSLLEIFKSL